MANETEKSSLPEPEIVVEPQPFDSIDALPRTRDFIGRIGSVSMAGTLEFIPRGSSGFDDIPIASVSFLEPRILSGTREVSAAPYEGQKADSAGEYHWRVWDDVAVVASVNRVIQHFISSHIRPLFENKD